MVTSPFMNDAAPVNVDWEVSCLLGLFPVWQGGPRYGTARSVSSIAPATVPPGSCVHG